MEASSQGSRRSRPSPRPGSSASSHTTATRMTPQSSSTTSSSLNLPQRPNTSRAVSGASLLQERLRERKGSARRQSVDLGERETMSSPVKSSSNGREERRPSSSGAKGMGVKQIEEHVSTLTKQNFNLKLELHHRRERQSKLESKLEDAEKQLEEQQELQDINEQLLSELEKRDQAVEEAVGIIVALEDRVEKLMQEREVVRNFDHKYESDYFSPQHNEPASSPPTFHENRSKAMVRMPSFLSEQSEGAEALRSLYLPNSQSYRESDTTLPKLLEEAPDALNSPRLSALSVSSFMSIYGNKQLALEDDHDEEQEAQRRHRKSESVEKWIDDRPASTAPIAIRNDIRKNQYLSINDVMESPLQRLEKLKLTLEKHNNSTVSTRLRRDRTTSTKDLKKPRDALRRVFTDKTSFDHQQGLPPTPDTISTSTLRHFQANSNDTLAQSAHSKPFIHSTSTSTFPTPRPASAGETITSRRDGHGWDTETATDDISSIASFSYLPPPPPARVQTPNLFNFHDFDRDSHDADYGANMMFTHSDTPRYAALRRSSVADMPHAHPSSDATVTPRRYIDSSSSSSGYAYGTSPLDTSPRPDPPDRRSSLSAATKLRRARAEASSGQTHSSSTQSTSNSNNATPKPEPKKPRLATRFFSRADSAPAPQQRRAEEGKAYHEREVEGYEYEDDIARATPPPIKRSRDSQPHSQAQAQVQPQSQLPRYRPTSAGAPVSTSNTANKNMNTLRRGSTFAFGGADGAGDYEGEKETERGAAKEKEKRRGSMGVDIEEQAAVGQKSGGARKWLGFGIGRSASLSRK